MIEKEPNQDYVGIQLITFHNDDPMNDQLENTGKYSFYLKPRSLLHSVVNSFSEANS